MGQQTAESQQVEFGIESLAQSEIRSPSEFSTPVEIPVLIGGAPSNGGTVRLPLIDGLRGIAAMWVVLFHSFAGEHVSNLLQQLPRWLVIGCFESGHYGVAVFFVLSGFVIAHSLRDAIVTPSFFCRFIARRSLRLDPPYFVAIAIVLVLGLVSAKMKNEAFEFPSLRAIAAHAVYLQDFLQIKPFDPVYWTLCYEIQFYLVLCLLLGVNRRFTPQSPQFVFVPAAIVSLVWGVGIRQENLVHGLFVSHWFAFLLGVFSHWAWSHKMNPIWYYLYAMCIFSSSLYRNDHFAMICVATSILLHHGAGRNWLNWRWLQFFGLISYSLYLLHNSVTGASFFVLRKFFGSSALSEALMLVATVAACVLAALLMWQTVERPFLRLAKRWFKSGR